MPGRGVAGSCRHAWMDHSQSGRDDLTVNEDDMTVFDLGFAAEHIPVPLDWTISSDVNVIPGQTGVRT